MLMKTALLPHDEPPNRSSISYAQSSHNAYVGKRNFFVDNERKMFAHATKS